MSSLQNINSATLGVAMPEITLPDGSKVQTGTVGALLVNIKGYNQAHATQDTTSMAQLEPAMKAAIPLLSKVGMFELFSAEEWIQGDNEGRKFVGRAYLDYQKEGRE
ncbi:unnamed protein product [Clonostachys rosea f. rosea IK726]|uniref:DUF7709 domain-containing protein n=3 Tax=Bionectria ochroleuca TaxID=29856 RepID=A0A0B7KMA9_BIOOC|nr:unnamed protein product [Clonostachys rosea f. rosea IK726]CAG9951019.1 unnamed protein product [Clonostachys rosea f. rosea IK726]